MSHSIFLVDAFSHGPFTGNPAGVCPLESEPDEVWMQGVAMEMNQAETAFFWPEGDGYRLRWFTPTVEVDLCGHATLASAHVLYETGDVRRETGSESPAIRFKTKSGELVCRQVGEMIEMDFPSEPPKPADCPGAKEAIGVEPVWMGANRMDWFFVLNSEEDVRSVVPDMTKINALGMRGVIVTAESEQGAPPPSPKGERVRSDFVSRFFAPQSGVPEDPVTGSAHCALGPYWAQRLAKQTVVGDQASHRGGYVEVVDAGDRVLIRGKASTALVGELKI